MAKCFYCDKSVHFGNNVSHSHRRSNRIMKSNIKRVKAMYVQSALDQARLREHKHSYYDMINQEHRVCGVLFRGYIIRYLGLFNNLQL